MPDVVDKETRSRMMAGIRGKDTRPELFIRRGLHAMGFRYRLHAERLPGKPDLVFPKYRAVIFVNGCFWHGHDCHLFRWPSMRIEFWRNKIGRTIERDKENNAALMESGWRVLRIWECAIKGREKLPPELIIQEAAGWLRASEQFYEIRGILPR